MLRGILLFSLAACGSSSASLDASEAQQSAVALLESRLDKADHVEIFVLSRTGGYSYSNERLIEESGVKVYRKCGSNCRLFMKEVIEHFSSSVPAECIDGQQDVLIAIGSDDSLVYSHFGRFIRFDGACYFNEDGVRRILSSPDFILD